MSKHNPPTVREPFGKNVPDYAAFAYMTGEGEAFGRAIFEAIEAHPALGTTWEQAGPSWQEAYTRIGADVVGKLRSRGLLPEYGSVA